jgi:hypothetical protein
VCIIRSDHNENYASALEVNSKLRVAAVLSPGERKVLLQNIGGVPSPVRQKQTSSKTSAYPTSVYKLVFSQLSDPPPPNISISQPFACIINTEILPFHALTNPLHGSEPRRSQFLLS